MKNRAEKNILTVEDGENPHSKGDMNAWLNSAFFDRPTPSLRSSAESPKTKKMLMTNWYIKS